MVAISMYLGYLNNYVDDRFITNSSYLLGNGTSDALLDYLFYNCRHTILNTGNLEDGWPMADGEIKATMNDYLNFQCSSSLRNLCEHVNGAVFQTHKNPRRHINSGSPTLIVMTKYTASVEAGKPKYHTVVAYGYNKNQDTFLVHLGYDQWETTYAEVIVSNVTINGYYTLYYKG